MYNTKSCQNNLSQRFLTWGPWMDEWGSVNLDGEKNTTLFSLTSYWSLTFHLGIYVRNKVIYGL